MPDPTAYNLSVSLPMRARRWRLDAGQAGDVFDDGGGCRLAMLTLELLDGLEAAALSELLRQPGAARGRLVLTVEMPEPGDG